MNKKLIIKRFNLDYIIPDGSDPEWIYKCYITERHNNDVILTTINTETYTDKFSAYVYYGTYEQWKQSILSNGEIVITDESMIEHIEKIRIDENTRTHEEFDAQGNTIFWSKEIIRNYTSVSGIDGQLWTRTEKTSDKIE